MTPALAQFIYDALNIAGMMNIAFLVTSIVTYFFGCDHWYERDLCIRGIHINMFGALCLSIIGLMFVAGLEPNEITNTIAILSLILWVVISIIGNLILVNAAYRWVKYAELIDWVQRPPKLF